MEDLGDHLLIKNVTPAMKEAIAKLYEEEEKKKKDEPTEVHHGTKIWKNENGEKHRVNGPAVLDERGNEYWYRNGDRHRDDDLPAIVIPDRRLEWFFSGKQHRSIHGENGASPSVIMHGEYLAWHFYGVLYARLDLNTMRFVMWPKDIPHTSNGIFSFILKSE